MIDSTITPKDGLIEALIGYTENHQISDRRFAREILGIHPSTWSYIKRRQRSFGPIVLRAISTHLPEFQPLVMDYIIGKDKDNGQ